MGRIVTAVRAKIQALTQELPRRVAKGNAHLKVQSTSIRVGGQARGVTRQGRRKESGFWKGPDCATHAGVMLVSHTHTHSTFLQQQYALPLGQRLWGQVRASFNILQSSTLSALVERSKHSALQQAYMHGKHARDSFHAWSEASAFSRSVTLTILQPRADSLDSSPSLESSEQQNSRRSRLYVSFAETAAACTLLLGAGCVFVF